MNYYNIGYKVNNELYFAKIKADNLKELVDFCLYNIYGEVVLIQKI